MGESGACLFREDAMNRESSIEGGAMGGRSLGRWERIHPTVSVEEVSVREEEGAVMRRMEMNLYVWGWRLGVERGDEKFLYDALCFLFEVTACPPPPHCGRR